MSPTQQAIRIGLIAAVLATSMSAQPRRLPDHRPGALALELNVTERSDVSRGGTVVTSGVPFPPGFLEDPSRLTVLDRSGRPVPTQASVISRWWKPAYDDSVRWARVSFPVDVAAGRYAKYTLVDRSLTADETQALTPFRATVVESGKHWVVSTGIARFTVPREGGSLIERAEIGGVNLLGKDGIQLLLTGGEWPEEGMKEGGLHFGPHARVVVEERGPVRVVLALYGAYRGNAPGTFKGGDLYDFTVRLYFDVGSSKVRLVHTLRNGRVRPTLYVWPVEDLSLIAHLDLGEKPGALLLGENEPVPVDLTQALFASLYQDSSGGPEWKELKARKNYAAWLARYTKTPPQASVPDARFTVKGASFPGYELRTEQEEPLERGARARGVMLVSGSRGGVIAAMRHFRVRCPAGLAATRTVLRAALWPQEYADPLFLEPGQRFTRELTLDFRLGRVESAELKQAHAVLDRRLLFTATPGWYVRTGAWDAGLALVKPPARRGGNAKASRDGLPKDALDGIDVGWDWFGWITGFNAGGAHWNQSTCFTDWLLWEDRLAFDVAEARTLWASDNALVHFDPCDLGRWWAALRRYHYHQWRHYGIQRKVFPGHVFRQVWEKPDDGHMAMFMWFEYYNLTGDRRVGESCLALGEHARAYMWWHNHDDVRTGGPGGGSVHWCRRRSPDDPSFRLHNRYTAWPLYNLALYYQLTGDRQVAAEAGNVMAGLRNTTRWSPPGFLTVNLVAAGDKRGTYANQLATGDPPTDCASQCYAHFQAGICATAIAQYYRETRDEEALDALVGIADFYTHHALVRDRNGRPHGWSYVFGDYWGPYKLEEFVGRWRPNWLNQNFRVVQPMGFITMLTGRRDYFDVLRCALAGRPGPNLRVLAAVQATTRPRVDKTPPGAVSDLGAEAVGGGKVRLTWTAPGDDGIEGTAARYQIKYSRAPIVERISGWPDRTPPLPKTPAEWEARAAAFNLKQRAFWAAFNAKGEPKPHVAGSRESLEVSGLEPGDWHFAIKTWDDGPNMSDLSNVVRVRVR